MAKPNTKLLPDRMTRGQLNCLLTPESNDRIESLQCISDNVPCSIKKITGHINREIMIHSQEAKQWLETNPEMGQLFGT